MVSPTDKGRAPDCAAHSFLCLTGPQNAVQCTSNIPIHFPLHSSLCSNAGHLFLFLTRPQNAVQCTTRLCISHPLRNLFTSRGDLPAGQASLLAQSAREGYIRVDLERIPAPNVVIVAGVGLDEGGSLVHGRQSALKGDAG